MRNVYGLPMATQFRLVREQHSECMARIRESARRVWGDADVFHKRLLCTCCVLLCHTRVAVRNITSREQIYFRDKKAIITSERKCSTCVLVIVAFRLLGMDAAYGTSRRRSGLLLVRSGRWNEWGGRRASRLLCLCRCGRWVPRLLCRLRHLNDEYDGSGKVRIGG